MSGKTLIIMRGLPWTGKSFRAKQILEEYKKNNIEGVIYSTDEFFYTQVKPENPTEYSFSQRFLGQAHKWNLVRAQKSIEQSCPLIIIDNTNTTASEPKAYVQYAVPQDYNVLIEEPTSEQWKVIRPFLQNKRDHKKELRDWAKKLEEGSKETHSVPFFAIERMMWRWQNGITVEQILNAPSYD